MEGDEEIIRKIRLGDQPVLLLLYKRNWPSLKNYILRNSGNEADAQDMLQEALVVFWEKVQKDSFEMSAKIDTYIFSVAKNLWLKHLRKNKRMQNDVYEEESPMQLEDDTTDYNEDSLKIVGNYIQRLGDVCRQLLMLFYFEEWEMDRIAEKLNLANADTAKAKKYQCKKKLAELIKKDFKVGDLL